MPSRVSWTIGFALALAGCRATPSTFGASATTPLLARVPDAAEGYRQTEHQTLPNDGGTIFRFRDTSSVFLSVILYPADAKARSSGRDAGALLREEGDKFAAIMQLQAQRGTYTTYRLLASRPDSVAIAPGLAPGHTAAAAVMFRGRPVVEYQRLFLIDTTFVKVRATVPEASWPRRAVDDAITAIVSALNRP